MQKKFLSLIFLISALVMLPACDWKSWVSHSCTSCSDTGAHHHGAEGSACCISLDGKSVLTQHDFENKFNQLCAARPDIQQALAALPAEQQQAFYDQFAEAMLAELLVARYVKQEGLANTLEYRKAAQEMHAAVETQLTNNVFQSDLLKKVEQQVTDQAAEQYYLENRDRVPLFKRAPFIDKIGGAELVVVEGFAKEADAQAFAKRASKQDITQLAKEAQRKMKKLGLVTVRSMEVDESIRSKVATYTTSSQIDVVKLNNGKFAVIKVVTVQPDTFKSFNTPEVRESVRSLLIRNELGKAVTLAMDELKQKYGAIIHRDNIMKLIKSDVVPQGEIQEETKDAAAPKALNA